MGFKRRLRERIILSFLIFGILLGALFAITALAMRQYLETALISDTMQRDLREHLERIASGGSGREPFSSRYWAWVGSPEKASERLPGLIPEGFPADPQLAERTREILSLEPGVHEIITSDARYRVAVERRSGLWRYELYDPLRSNREALRFWIVAPEEAESATAFALFDTPRLAARAAQIAALPSGEHSVQGLRLVVEKPATIAGYVIYDATPDPREQALLLGFFTTAFVVFALLALLLAIWTSKRVMLPVTDLAHRIDQMGDDTEPQRLVKHYANDEVGQLARALDDYADRLTALVVRDKEFNADVSHELRTPLAVIRSATELLLAQPDLAEKTRVRLHRIERASRQSADLTEALLHLVRGEREEPVSHDPQRVDRIVEEVIDFKRYQLDRKPVEVHCRIIEPFCVHAPAAVISVAVGNLIGNAFKYTPQGHVDIRVGGGKVVVEDTGPGVEPDELHQIFTRHYRGSSAEGKGSGLGLAIVQRFCDLYDWHVRIEPREESGLRAILDFDQSALVVERSRGAA